MSEPADLEQRVAVLERDLAELRQRISSSDGKKNWIEKITGTFENDPDFAEILRLGQEIRRADRPDDEVEG